MASVRVAPARRSPVSYREGPVLTPDIERELAARGERETDFLYAWKGFDRRWTETPCAELCLLNCLLVPFVWCAPLCAALCNSGINGDLHTKHPEWSVVLTRTRLFATNGTQGGWDYPLRSLPPLARFSPARRLCNGWLIQPHLVALGQGPGVKHFAVRDPTDAILRITQAVKESEASGNSFTLASSRVAAMMAIPLAHPPPGSPARGVSGDAVHGDEEDQGVPLQQLATRPAGSADPIDLLCKLADLHAAGVLTDAEFDAKKAELLARVRPDDGPDAAAAAAAAVVAAGGAAVAAGADDAGAAPAEPAPEAAHDADADAHAARAASASAWA